MRQSNLFSKTQKNIEHTELSKNYALLVRGGFVNQEMAGVYTFLPLGLRVIKKIERIVREEIESVGGQEVFLPGLQPQENWEKTGRWSDFNALFKVSSQHGSKYALGPTHEEIVVPLAKRFIHSYKDLPKTDAGRGLWPKAVYQIQTKFRDEKRAKSGLLRGREFIMKDLYSYHQDSDDLDVYYEEVRKAYTRIFNRLDLRAIVTESSGGTFSKLSHEFQVECDAGEDIIYYCKECDIARNREIIKDFKEEACSFCGRKTRSMKAAEVGNIFKLNTKFSSPFELAYTDESGHQNLVYMGCYGIGISRLVGVIAETHNDERGIRWPRTVAPYSVHLIVLGDNLTTRESAEKVYTKFVQAGAEILYDDRSKIMTGEKFADADILGCPYRLVVSERTGDKIEFKKREGEEAAFKSIEEVLKEIHFE